MKSVLTQVGDFEIEHIVIDGAASDETARVAAALQSNAILISERDEGRYDAMNKGIARASGDLLWFMHSGDRFGSNESIMAVLSRVCCSQEDWGYGLARLIDVDGTFKGTFGDLDFSLRRLALGTSTVPHQACFFGSKIISRIGNYDLDHGLAADQLYVMRAAMLKRPVIVPEYICNFDITGAGSSRWPYCHYSDMRVARRKTGISYSGYAILDSILTLCLTGLATTRYLAVRALRAVANVASAKDEANRGGVLPWRS